jgi:hypothetical protein
MALQIDKAALLLALKPKTVSFAIDGFGEIGIVQLSVAEVDSLRAVLKSDDKTDQFGLNMVMLSVVDSDGNRVFADEDMPALKAASNAVMDELVGKTLEVNGFKKVADAKN